MNETSSFVQVLGGFVLGLALPFGLAMLVLTA